MLTRTKLFSASLALALLVVVGATCLAQQPQNQTQNQSPARADRLRSGAAVQAGTVREVQAVPEC